MTRSIRVLALALAPAALALAAPARAAAETGHFVIRLGQDTTAVERYTRTPQRLEVHQVGRTPRVLERRFTYEYANGALAKFSMTAGAPGAATPTQRVEGTFGGPDSARVRITNAQGQVQTVAAALPPGTLAIASTSPWVVYEDAIMTMVRDRRDSVRTTAVFIGSSTSNPVSLRRLGRDSVIIDNLNQRNDRFRARIDRDGRILGVRPMAGTLKLSAERVDTLDLAALAASFAAREQTGSGMGVLSPRDTVTVTAGGASLWFDYSRPAKRGRVIFGNVVPYGELWRTGANSATQFRTDKPLDFGGTVVAPGSYTLWTIPSPDGWKLIVNGETGQSGTAHDPAKDLNTIPLKLSALPEVVERFTIGVDPGAQGGVLRLDWDTTRASAAFTVRP